MQPAKHQSYTLLLRCCKPPHAIPALTQGFGGRLGGFWLPLRTNHKFMLRAAREAMQCNRYDAKPPTLGTW